MNREPRIYVAGPYSKGDVAQNVRKAIEVGNALLDRGFVPFIPHLTHFWHLLCPHEYDEWMRYDEQWLRACDCLYRIAGESNGSDIEVEVASTIFIIPVFYTLDDAAAWKDTKWDSIVSTQRVNTIIEALKTTIVNIKEEE